MHLKEKIKANYINVFNVLLCSNQNFPFFVQGGRAACTFHGEPKAPTMFDHVCMWSILETKVQQGNGRHHRHHRGEPPVCEK